MLRLFLLSCIGLCAFAQSASAQSAAQVITIVVEAHQSLASESDQIALSSLEGDERLRGVAEYAVMLSGSGKLTAAVSSASGVRVSAMSSNEATSSSPLELGSESHSDIGGLGPTFGTDFQIAYAASIDTAAAKTRASGVPATITLTLTN